MKTLLHGLFSLILAQALTAEINSEQIQGYWKFSLKEEGMEVSSISSYLPTGQFTDEGSGMVIIGDKEEKLSYSVLGRWELVGEILIVTVTESSAPQLYPKCMIIKSKITKISDKQMTFISELDKKEYTTFRTVSPNPNPKEEK